MIKQLLSLFGGESRDEVLAGDDRLPLAVAALLVEAALQDTAFDEEERATVRHLLAERFRLGEAEVGQLLEEAEARARQSAQLFGFTSTVVKEWSAEERVELIEMLWQVAYSDGALDPHEDALLRRVAGLLHVTDRDRSLARRRALERLGRTDLLD